MIKAVLKAGKVLAAILLLCGVAVAQPTAFNGGDGGGFANKSTGTATCAPTFDNPFNGGDGGGSAEASVIKSVCTEAFFTPFDGGIGEGHSFASRMVSVCTPVSFTAFSGGDADGEANANLINSVCTSVVPLIGINTLPANGCSGTPIIIQGFGFTGATRVMFTGADADSFKVNSDSIIQVNIPMAATSGPVIITGSNGTTLGGSVIAISTSIPLVVRQPIGGTICANQPATFTVGVQGTALPAYQWRRNGVDIGGATDSIFTINAITPTDSGQYSVIVTNSCGADTSGIAILLVGIPEVVQATASDTMMCSGDSVSICATGSFTSYTWNTGDTGVCIYARSASAYWVSATSSNGCIAQSDQVTIDFYPAPSIQVSINRDTLSTAPALAYQWFLNGGLISNANSQIHIATENGTYSVQVTDSNGCKATSSEIIYGVTVSRDLHNGSLFMVYPNPVYGSDAHLRVSTSLVGQQYEIMEMNGKVVASKTIRKEEEIIDVSLFAAGIYIVKINSEVRKLVRQ